MSISRPFLVITISLFLVFFTVPQVSPAHPPIGILTLATHVHLDEAAFPGLSVFEGELLSTEVEGRLGLRAGHSMLTFGGATEVSLIPLEGGLHVGVNFGSIRFSSAENEAVAARSQFLRRKCSRAPPSRAL